MAKLGFYVHYHGLGHKHRTEAILRHATMPATVITSRIDDSDWHGPTLKSVRGIACDIDGVPGNGLSHAAEVPSLHYAPLWTDNITHRVAQYTAWLDQEKPDLMVIDVSAEISMLTRLASIPQIVMRQHGDRCDDAHLGAYAAAHSLLAPFPRQLEDEITPKWVREKTVYLSGFCRHADGARRVEVIPKRIVVMFGRGGSCDVHTSLRRAAETLSDHEWFVVGKSDDQQSDQTPANLRFVGWVDDPRQYVQSAEIVVSSAGHNSVMELGSQRRRFIAIAEQRPFEEQLRKTVVLQRERLAIGLPAWPDSSQWPALISAARELDPSLWDNVFAADGGKQAVAHIEAVASWSHSQRHLRSGANECRLAS